MQHRTGEDDQHADEHRLERDPQAPSSVLIADPIRLDEFNLRHRLKIRANAAASAERRLGRNAGGRST